MMLRRVSDQARVEGIRALQRALDGVRGRAPQRRAELPRPLALPARPPNVADADPDSDQSLKALDRIADIVDRLAAQLDSQHRERAGQLESIEFLLREMVISTVLPTTARPEVRGGVIDPDALIRVEPETTIFAQGYLAVDTPVEVRSRFHDRWICGFSIAEVVEDRGHCRYRLTRRSDGIPLPILFDTTDVRASGPGRSPDRSASKFDAIRRP